MDQIIGRLIETLTEPVDYETIKSGTDIQSSTRLSDYLTALQNSFVIASIPYIDPSKKRMIMRKRRKYYFRDPFIYHAFRSWVYGLEPFESSRYAVKDPTTRGIIVENLTCEYLVRYAVVANRRSLVDPLSHIPYIGYWKTKRGEVDFIIKLGNKAIPIEVKYREKISKVELGALIRLVQAFKNKGIVVSKKPEDLLEEHYYVAIPAPIFMLMF